MATGLEGKTVLITGASRNIGRAAAILFAKEGANLALCTRESMDELEGVATEVEQAGARVVTEQCDITDVDSVSSFVQKTHDQFGSIDVVINNAVFRAEANFLEQNFEDWQRSIAVNLDGPFHVCRKTLPFMMDKCWGRIINFSGIGPYLGLGVAKSTAKLGIVGFTRAIAREFAPYNITANCVGPGAMEVERDPWLPKQEIRPQLLIQQLGQPEDIGQLLLFLASNNSGFMTGQNCLVNGGEYFL